MTTWTFKNGDCVDWSYESQAAPWTEMRTAPFNNAWVMRSTCPYAMMADLNRGGVGVPLVAGSRFLVQDAFRTQNNFYGGTLGLVGEMRRERWSLGWKAKVSLGTTRQVVDIAASDERTRKLELFSIEWDEGPCRDCFRSGTQVFDVPLDTETATARWPRFAPKAVGAGFTSVAAAPLRLHEQVIGALNLFRDRPGALSASELRLGQALADTAAIGILHQRAMREQMTVIAQLQHALDSRVVIEQAKGYLAHHRGQGVDEAFTTLRAYARTHQMKLTELASNVLADTIDPTLLPPDD